MGVKSFIRNVFLTVSIILTLMLFNCGEDSLNAPQDFVSGTITYLETNLNFNGGYYTISIYGESADPFTHNPVRTDSLAPGINNGTASVYYKISGLASGSYYIGSTWRNSSNGNLSLYGVYGCDENINCPNRIKVTVPNYAGTGALNFKSRTQ
jgi:hypothetical protein